MAVIRGFIFFAVVVATLMTLDYVLAKRAGEFIDQVEKRKRSEKLIVFKNQPADICRALTGTVWIKPVMIFTTGLKIPEGCEVSVKGGYCSRSQKHDVLFTCR
jgi:hypothetical protein